MPDKYWKHYTKKFDPKFYPTTDMIAEAPEEKKWLL